MLKQFNKRFFTTQRFIMLIIKFQHKAKRYSAAFLAALYLIVIELCENTKPLYKSFSYRGNNLPASR